MLVEEALRRRAKEGHPVRVALVGVGFVGTHIARVLGRTEGIELVAAAGRRRDRAELALGVAGRCDVTSPRSRSETSRARSRGHAVAFEDPIEAALAPEVDVVIEATGDTECGAGVSIAAIEAGRHVVLVNAGLDATLGPLLKAKADASDVVLTGGDGDEPAGAMDLVRFTRMIGCTPVMAGNVKGLYDPYRTPETQRAFAESVGQRPETVTSFADGTKLSMESTQLANATGFGVVRRGMTGYEVRSVADLPGALRDQSFASGGRIDFVLGPTVGSGSFVVCWSDDPPHQAALRYFKLGDGPLYVFHRPYHLPGLEAGITVARAALFGEAAVAPLGAPVCEVATHAKRDLTEGQTLDGVGGFDCYGLIENASTFRAENLLPIGLAEGCRLRRDVTRDAPIRLADVETPAGRLCDALYAEQVRNFAL
jgi:predicted homoserine dehydrogenase-like protein